MEREANIVVRAVDRLTKPVTRMKNNLSKLTAPATRASRAVGELGRVTGVDRLTRQFSNLGGAIGGVTGRLSGLTAGLAGLTGIGLGAGGAMLAKGVIDTGASFEKFQTVLTTIEGSSEKAKASMDWISNFTATTPYELQQVTDGFVKLRAYGIDPMDGTLSLLGDTAAAMGKDLNDAVEMLADAQTGEFERLKEFGLRGSVDGDTARISFVDAAGNQRVFEAARDNVADLRAAVLNAFRAKGFEGAMDDLSKTWAGMWSNLMDQWTLFQKRIADAGVFDFLKGKLDALLATIQKMEEDGSLQEWAQKISDAMVAAFTKVENFVRSVDWSAVWDGIKRFGDGILRVVDFLGGWENAMIAVLVVLNGGLIASIIQLGISLGSLVAAAIPVIVNFGAMLPTALAGFGSAFTAASTLVASGIKFMSAAIAANPIGAAITAIAVAAYAIYENWDNVVSWFTAKIDRIKEAFSEGFLTGIVSILREFNPAVILADAVNGMINWLFGIDLKAVGTAWVDGLLDGVVEAWAGLTSWLSEAFAKLTGWLPDWAKDKLGITGPDGELSAPSGSKAGGATRAAAATAALVAGPAAATATPADVVASATTPPPAAVSKASSSRGAPAAGLTVSVAINGDVYGVDDLDARIQTGVERGIRDAMDRKADEADAALYD